MTKSSFPSDTAEKFVLRLPAGMREKIAASAKEAGRSMNAEMVHRLQESFYLDLLDDRDPNKSLNQLEIESLKKAMERQTKLLVEVYHLIGDLRAASLKPSNLTSALETVSSLGNEPAHHKTRFARPRSNKKPPEGG
ncbi:Arc family DNA-binding protein [Schauerella aestuarii]|uniref:Arc family DNA-binding protein n=1 Tax=Schauerella aestuarii TaxID=2511204 RepID=UPI0013704D26|nr:Arc family DNA-binding protein [Achromobacter aestuarii]MYZ41426.1 Arc family DNA-binding protein [Achromobacter aestuarii]